MDKIWIKFLSDWKDKNGTEFKKGTSVQVEKDAGESLIKLSMAEKIEAPKAEDEVKKAFTEIQEEIKTSVTNLLKEYTTELQKSIKGGFKIPAIAKDEKLEKMGGFRDDGEFALAIKSASEGRLDPRLIGDPEELKKAPSGQHTRSDSEGGYLVPQDLNTRILESVFDDYDGMNVIGKTDQNFCSGDSMKLPTMPEVSRKEGYRDAGVIAYWQAEAEQYTSSTIKWGSQRLEINKVTALLYATEEMLSDASVALPPIFDRKAGNALRFKVNKALYDGTGVGQPMGLIRCGSTITVPLAVNYGASSNLQQSTTQAVILHQNLVKMYTRMLPRYLAGAAWYVHPNMIEPLQYVQFNDNATTNLPVFMPPNGGGNQAGILSAPYGTLMGRPIIPWEYCYDAGQRGDICFANWSPYQTLQKQGEGVKSSSSIHVRWLYDEQAFKFSFRIDGKSSLPAPIEDLNGSTTRSFAVLLASRASEGSSSGL